MTKKRSGGNKSNAKVIGIIAEDRSDIDTLSVLIRKITKSSISFKSYRGDGCGKILGKCRAWSIALKDEGCQHLLIVHDLDKKNPRTLRGEIEGALGCSPISSHVIVIPVRELEAWLLADHGAIARAMKIKSGINKVQNPETIQNPKEHLGRLIYTKSRHSKRYINTIHNAKIAMECSIASLFRCDSFEQFHKFVSVNI